jgi:tetratricopeptide (TPR) repeat protein
MDQSANKDQEKKKIYEVKTFSVPFPLRDHQGNLTVNTNTPPKEQIINQAFKFQSQGNISEATKYYQYFINQGYNDYRVFSNYGNILKDLGNLSEAELFTRKAIKIKPNLAVAHYNLGNILRDFGNLQEAELSIRKAIEINPDFAEAHSNLGIILKDLGNLPEAELFTRRAIEINPNFAMAHLNLGNILRDIGNLQGAELSTRKAIEIKPDYAEAHSNLGIILKDLGNLPEAELSTKKAIEVNPGHAEAYSNLGTILTDLGKLEEAELSTRKAIELRPDYAKAYYSLSLLKYSDENKILHNQLFSKSILNNKLKKELIDIYFARANILHKEKNYKDSSKFLRLGNELKLTLNPSEADWLINQSKVLLIESNKEGVSQKEYAESSQSIFIVGMPRSGSTLLESILSMKDDVYDLGEVNILEESFLQCKKSKQELNLAELYVEKVTNKTELNITTNKWLYNYQYAGIIAKQIPNAKIIHCYRNPLDNILSIYRAHFARKNYYSSSLVDCTRVYLDQEKIMTQYKNRFGSNIYDLNYDLLVSNPYKEIKSLISWLGWNWDDAYLSPHLNPRSVATASNVQVRSPINSKSIGGWKNYKDMLQPAIEILSKNNRYRDIIA